MFKLTHRQDHMEACNGSSLYFFFCLLMVLLFNHPVPDLAKYQSVHNYCRMSVAP